MMGCRRPGHTFNSSHALTRTESRMTRLTKLILAAAVLSACARSPAPVPAPGEPSAGPFSVILFIGDGTGLGYWSAARDVAPLAVDTFPVVGLVGTRAADSKVTDSAAGATAFAAGVKTYNGAIGVGPDTQAVTTVVEEAAAGGKATGLVATSTITHATPAAFAAHVPSRDLHFQIAEQLAGADVDVLLGGGRVYFDPAERPDGLDLLGRLREHAKVVDSVAELVAMSAARPPGSEAAGPPQHMERVDRLVGFTARQNPPAAPRRSPTLAQLTRTALDVLAPDEDGFFLMVEASQIDWRGHDNAPLYEVMPELQDLDGAIREALRFQAQRPNTLIVVVADHDTGGLAVHYDEMGVFRAHYTTDGHTGELVPLFAIGPGAAELGGIRENDEVGRILMRLITSDGPAAGH